MIYPEYLQEEVFRFCKISGIPITDGMIVDKYVDQVQRFISHKTKNDRQRTRDIEEKNKLSINPLIQSIIKDFSESPIEEFMYQGFITVGIEKYCQPQFKIGTKRVDFAFPIAKLVVECDGKEYHFSDEEQIERDQKRDVYLAKKGWMVKHFDGLIIRRNIKVCMEEIKSTLNPFIEKFSVV